MPPLVPDCTPAADQIGPFAIERLIRYEWAGFHKAHSLEPSMCTRGHIMKIVGWDRKNAPYSVQAPPALFVYLSGTRESPNECTVRVRRHHPNDPVGVSFVTSNGMDGKVFRMSQARCNFRFGALTVPRKSIR